MSINESLIKLIKKYQNNKPAGTPARCVHYPTCSNYSIECYEKFNFFKATFLTIKRILFCTPLNRKFYDPVPYTKEEKKINKELDKLAESVEDILLEHYKRYPQMELNDFIKLIYQNSFGPRHMHNPTKEDVIRYLNKEMELITNENEIIEDIGNGYVRVYLSKKTNMEKISNNFLFTISSTGSLFSKDSRKDLISLACTLNTCKNSSKSNGYILIVCKEPTGADFKFVISTPNKEPLKI